MDLFNLIRAPNPTKVKTGTRPRVAHEVPLLTITASRVIEMEDPATSTDSSGVPSTIERSHLDFANENPHQQSTRGNRTEDQGQEIVALEVHPLENVTTTGVAPKAGLAEKIAAIGPHSTSGGKSLAAMGLGMGFTFPVPTSQDTPVDVSDPDLLSFANPQIIPIENVAQSSNGAVVTGDPELKNTSFTYMVGSLESIYQSEWGVTNGCPLDAPEAYLDLVDHIAPPGYFSELRHLHNDDFLNKYNINLARQVAIGSQLRLRFEQEAKLLKKSVAQLARRDQRIQARENEIKNLEALLEVETDMKKTAEAKKAELEKIMKCGESTELRQVFADIVSARIAKGMSEGPKYEVEHGNANLDLEAIEAYDSEADTKYVVALHALKDLKYPNGGSTGKFERCSDRCDNDILTSGE
uniref:Transposase (Putative), gypsy type n=1 Tax=Tanacetum cinerariifolium TaxID=118510 RepID=A0A6L2M4J2_TANCI|nr:hypothetical protein [Tanacetum cinerariifolium]